MTPHFANTTPAQIEDQAIQLHREMVEIVRAETGMHERFANEIAAAIVAGMRKKFGGQTLGRRGLVYIPAPSKHERNAAICAEFNGTNAAEVCKKYAIGRARLYQIVARKGSNSTFAPKN